jgi:hypothetical protein
MKKKFEFDWREHWRGMPEFVQPDKRAPYTLRVNLMGRRGYDGRQAFVTIHFQAKNLCGNLAKVSQRLNVVLHYPKAKEIMLDMDEAGLQKLLFANPRHKIRYHSTWFPWRERETPSDFVYRQEDETAVVNPEYPVYIISKGRWERPLTARALERMGVPYTIVVEPKEYDKYRTTFDGVYDEDKRFVHGKILSAPENYSERGQGSIPVRNFVWDLAIKENGMDGRHWLLDDNIPTFYRLHRNQHVSVETGAIFRAAEVFVDRYENVAIAGLQNNQFTVAKQEWHPFVLNHRVFSCTLIKNDLNLTTKEYVFARADGSRVVVPACDEPRWRGRYNEDNDLCVRALKLGWCTVYFNAFNSDKVATMVMKGGNTDELYAGDGRRKMAESLYAQHPDVVKVTGRWNRKQANVNVERCVEIGRIKCC